MSELIRTAKQLDRLCREQMDWMEERPDHFDSDTWDAYEALTYILTRLINAQKDV